MLSFENKNMEAETKTSKSDPAEETDITMRRPLEVQTLKDPPRTMTTASSSDPSGASRHGGSEDEGESAAAAYVPLNPPIQEASNHEEEEEIGEDDEEDEEPTETEDETPVIEISKMVIETPEEAKKIAEIILLVLEQDLYELKKRGKLSQLLNRHFSDPALEKDRRKKYLRDHFSKASLVSNLSALDFDLEQPSTLNLSYEKIDNSQTEPLHKLSDKFKKDASTQVDLHRGTNLESESRSDQQDEFSQTKEFTILRRATAHREFLKLYPKPDDWFEPPPASRDGSLLKILDLADVHDLSDDVPPVGPKPRYKIPLTERMLKPMRGDYQKQETYWTGSTFKGDLKDNMFEIGHYDYPTLAKYESEFKDGHIHSKKHFGLITYPRGDTFEGTWRKGRFTNGKITFADKLKFEPMGWKYCTPPDRRFFMEKTHGVQGVGETAFSDRLPPPHIQYDCYDVGDGVYNPKDGTVVNYQGVLLRKTTEYEHRWIVLNCRKRKPLTECYEPRFTQERTPDFYADFYPKNT